MANPNTASFPSTLPTDSDLFVGADNALTTTSSSVDDSTTTILVTDGSVLAEPSLIKIDSELIHIQSISTDTLTVVRGFGGTTAVAHAAGANVFGFVFAYHHNQIAAELKAITTELGVNGSNFIKVGNTATLDDLTLESSDSEVEILFDPNGTRRFAIESEATFLKFNRYNDAGDTVIDSPLTIQRSNDGTNTSMSIAIENVDVDSPVSLQELGATPSDPVDGAEARLYVKDDKLVIQYNDAATVRYKYLDLTGTGVTWVHTTTAP